MLLKQLVITEILEVTLLNILPVTVNKYNYSFHPSADTWLAKKSQLLRVT